MSVLDKVLIIIYLFVLFVVSFFGVYYRSNKPKEYHYLVLLIILTFFVEFFSHYSLLFFGKVIGWIFAIFLPIQYFLISLYFRGV